MGDNVDVVEVEDEVGQGEVGVSEKVVKDETNETDVVAPKAKSKYKRGPRSRGGNVILISGMDQPLDGQRWRCKDASNGYDDYGG
ncbi:hypothetical protein ACLOJK_041209 [Asimina triloba]